MPEIRVLHERDAELAELADGARAHGEMLYAVLLDEVAAFVREGGDDGVREALYRLRSVRECYEGD